MGIRTKGTIAYLIFSFLWINSALAQLPIPDGRRLRDIVADQFPEGNLLIGATTGSWGIGQKVGTVMDREFSYVTPENDFKQSVIRANPSAWNWERADAWLDHIVENNQVLRIHGPIAPQCSNWAKEDNRTAAELSAELDTFMTALCMRYNGVPGIKYLDVVNEIALDDGSWHHPKPGTDQWENPWLIIGQDTDPNKTPLYVKQAFEIANKYAPDLKQIINNHCHPGTAGMEKVKQTILYLRNLGYRVDGLGWQAHVEVGWETEENLQHLRDVIDWCQTNNLEFHVTEFDAWIMNRYTQTFQGQANTYKAILDVMLEKLDQDTMGWNTWHITDGEGWKTERLPALFDDQYRPKPAYYAMQLALETRGDYTTPHQVEIQVQSSLDNQFIQGCQVTLNQLSLSSNDTGYVAFEEILPSRYLLEITHPDFMPVKQNIYIYKDTSLRLILDPRKYQVGFKVLEAYNLMPVPDVTVAINGSEQITELDGSTAFSFIPGSYQVAFTKAGFQSVENNYAIRSDTLIIIELNRTHADIKFKITSDLQPLKETMVILGSDTLKSNLLGIATFGMKEVNRNYNFRIKKQWYHSIDSSFFLNTDTTLEVTLNASHGYLKTSLSYNNVKLTEAMVVCAEDTAYSNSNGLASFFHLPLDSVYQVSVFASGYNEFTQEVLLRKDTILYWDLSTTSTQYFLNDFPLRVYPVPAHEFIWVESDEPLAYIAVIDLMGRRLLFQQVAGNRFRLSLDGLPEGYFLLQVMNRMGALKTISIQRNKY